MGFLLHRPQSRIYPTCLLFLQMLIRAVPALFVFYAICLSPSAKILYPRVLYSQSMKFAVNIAPATAAKRYNFYLLIFTNIITPLSLNCKIIPITHSKSISQKPLLFMAEKPFRNYINNRLQLL